MNNYLIPIVSCVIVLLMAALVFLLMYYRKVIKAKDRGIIRQINEQDRLKKELEYINTEKKVMEKFLKSKVEGVVWIVKSNE